jgi:S-(hydroxymethyl)glutathione dehydrogenase/alcohol dehydrogenase
MVDAVHSLTDGGPDYVFEAIGRPSTVELAIAALPVAGTAVLVGMTPVGERAGFEVYPFVDGARRILGSNYGSAEPAIDFPRYAAWSIEGRLPVTSLIDRRIALDDVEDAFDAMREGRFIRQVIEFG